MRRLFLALSLLIALASAAQAAERILDFKSRLEVGQDGTLFVTETIRVAAEGDQIRHGIYRDFPTTYTDDFGLTVRVGFRMVGARLDGRSEPYHLESRGNGVRVYIGQKDIELRPGTYTYTISYTTTGQIGFFKDRDELYWNVTGNGWIFPIDRPVEPVIFR